MGVKEQTGGVSGRRNRLRAVVRREYPLVGVVVALVCGQVVGSLVGVWPAVGLVGGAAALGFGAWVEREGLVIGALAVCVGIVTTLGVMPNSEGLPVEGVWRGEVLEVPRYVKTGAVGITVRAVPVDYTFFESSRRRGPDRSGNPVLLACRAVDLPWRNIAGIERGDTFFFRARLAPVERVLNPFAYPNMLRRRGVSASCRITHATPVVRRARSMVERFRAAVERRVGAVVGSGERWGLLLAMSIGARDTLSVGTERAFKSTGLAHLLVVSGFQVTLVYYLVAGGILGVWRLVGARFSVVPAKGIARGVGLLAAILFVAVSGIDGSSVRAAFAVVFTVVARTLERGGGLCNSVLVSLLGVSLVWPGAVLEPGVELTYAALLGICLGRGIFPRGEGRWGGLGPALGVTLGVWLLTSIVSLGWFGAIAPVGLVLNPLLAPVLGTLGCHGAFVGMFALFSGVDPHGTILHGIGQALLWGRDIVGAVARSGLVVPELDPLPAAIVATVLAVVSAHLLHMQLRGWFSLRLGRAIGSDGAGATESRLSGISPSDTLRG